MQAELNATPFGQKLQARVNSLPEEINPLEPEIVEAFEELITPPVVPKAKAAKRAHPHSFLEQIVYGNYLYLW
jgi:hypothetical protein